MKLKLKEEVLDLIVTCPFTGRDVVLRFLDRLMYPIFYKAYKHLFEEKSEEPKKTKD